MDKPTNGSGDNEIDEVIAMIGEIIEAEELEARVVNMEKIRAVKTVYNVVREIVSGDNVEVSYELFEPFESMGSVSIQGNNIKVTDPAEFSKMIGMASVFDIYPKVDGTVQADFTFHDLTRRE